MSPTSNDNPTTTHCQGEQANDVERKRKEHAKAMWPFDPTKKLSRGGVDVEGAEQPEGPVRSRKNDSFVANPTPLTAKYLPSYREARRKAAAYESSGSILPDDNSEEEKEKSEELPGAIAVAGTFSYPAQGVEINAQPTQSSQLASLSYVYPSMISADETQEEAIVAAHLVEDIEKQDRAKLRQEIYDEAEKAEVVDTKRQRRCFLLVTCLCVLMLAGAGLAVGFVLRNRQVELNNSLCGNAAPIFLGDVISGNVGNADVSKLETCSPEEPFGDVQGRWFTFLGDGTTVSASTCGSTNFDSEISVYSGSSCDSLTCVTFNNDSALCCPPDGVGCNSKAAAVTFSTEFGVNYYIYVHGTNVEADARFQLTLSPSTNSEVINDFDQQCFDETTAFYNNGIQADMESISQSLIQVDTENACQTMQDGTSLCVFDGLNGTDTDLDTTCQALGGRYIIKYFSLVCQGEAIELKFTNYQDCVSVLCSDEWIDNAIRTLMANQLIPFAEESSGLSCETGHFSWADGD